MFDLAVPTTGQGNELDERAYLGFGFSSGDFEKHRHLLETAREACPQVPAIRCNQLVRFYFTAALAATEITPALRDRWKNAIEVDAPSGRGEKLIFYSAHTALARELQPPRSPRFVIAAFGGTDFSREPRGIGSFFESEPDLTHALFRTHEARPKRAVVRQASTEIEPFKAFTELKQWLRLSSKQLAQLIGIKRTTPNAWKREGRRPRPETELRLLRLHRYVSELASRPDAANELAQIRPVLPVLTKAIYAQAALPSETLHAAGVDIPFDWRKLNAFQARTKIAITADEDGGPLGKQPEIEGMLIEEDEDDLDLLY
jgi:hypothetical protein